ncbi:MAG: aminotransferase class I/II-fold pyridoxal phosphate-dependent enzyme [Paracoccaceae bacterium]|nr:aminotransferase class I/II-fold pyridoxal phosphate-dependent enzyme [Paracoccaceae bacterium]
MEEIFDGSFTQQEPISEIAISAALRVLRSGRLHRYNVIEGEVAETTLLEEEFARLIGSKYSLAVASGGYAMGCALRAIGVKVGDFVLSNAFTLAPVPGAIAGVGALPVFVDTVDNLTIDLEDLEQKIKSSGSKVLLLSHMRGHICDMDKLMAICNTHNVKVIEDCAHTMGASWAGVASGRHGLIGCYSCQTYKHLNSGEGGLLVTDDDEIIARAIVLSGSYMLFEQHRSIPDLAVFEKIKLETPNISGRMDNLRAAILRPQLSDLSDRVFRWNERYKIIEDGLRNVPIIKIIERAEDEAYVGSSLQFKIPKTNGNQIKAFLNGCMKRGVELKWFGASAPKAFTSKYDSWAYIEPQELVNTDRILSGLIDMRLPLTFSLKDCQIVARIISSEAMKLSKA